MDHWGGDLPKTKSGATGLITMIDAFTRWPEAYPVSQHTAQVAADALFEYICHHGLMDELLTDNGPEFSAVVFKILCKRMGVQKLFTSGWHPRCNGAIERLHRPLGASLHILSKAHPASWDEYVQPVLFAFRTSPIDSTGFSPFELEHGRKATLPTDVLFSPTSDLKADAREHGLQLPKILKAALDAVHAVQSAIAAKNKAHFDRNHHLVTFKAGEVVMVYSHAQVARTNSKFQDRSRGPFKIVRAIGPNVYEVAAIPGVTPIVDAERFNTSVNVKCLERYHRHDPAKFSVGPKLDPSAASIKPPLSPALPAAVVRPISFFGDRFPELDSAVRGPSLEELFAPPGSRHRAQFQVIGAAASAPVPGSKRKKSSALPPEPILDRPLEQAPAHLRAPTNRFPARARRSTPLYQDGLLRGFFANVVDLS